VKLRTNSVRLRGLKTNNQIIDGKDVRRV
jgi:hypothetical protein